MWSFTRFSKLEASIIRSQMFSFSSTDVWDVKHSRLSGILLKLQARCSCSHSAGCPSQIISLVDGLKKLTDPHRGLLKHTVAYILILRYSTGSRTNLNSKVKQSDKMIASRHTIHNEWHRQASKSRKHTNSTWVRWEHLRTDMTQCKSDLWWRHYD